MRWALGTRAVHPGSRWRVARRMTQGLALLALLFSPLFGGWQRLDFTTGLATWEDPGFNLPPTVLEQLPLGDAPAKAHRANQLMGGGIAFDVSSWALMDPLAGALAVSSAGVSLRALIALAIPVLLGLSFGRVFCGWLCPFGTLSRAISGLRNRIPGLPRLELPRRRPLRWILLAAGVIATLAGAELLLYLTLPYVLLQQSVYAAWLLGGGSVVLAVLCGLLAAGLLFGETVYCAALCPTGAMLSLLGRGRRVALTVSDSAACGETCGLCTCVCWLQLDPASGDPGPDCDLCGRCVPICPKRNLVVGRAGGRSGSLRAVAGSLLLAVAMLASGADAREAQKPRLVLDAEIEGVPGTLAVSVVDRTRPDLDAEWARIEAGVELSVFLTRGRLEPPAENGRIPGRDVYEGPLRVEIERVRSAEHIEFHFEEPNSPVSAQQRSIYRRSLPIALEPGDRISVAAVAGWLDEPVTLILPGAGTRPPASEFLIWFAAALLAFSGLLSLAFVPAGPASRRTMRPGL